MEDAAVEPPAIAPAYIPVDNQYSPLDFDIGFDAAEFDLDGILAGFRPSGDDSVLWDPSHVAASPESVNSVAPAAAAAAAAAEVVAGVEKFLFEDDSRAEVDVDGFVVQDFFKDILANFGDGSSSDGSGSDDRSPVAAAAAIGEEEKAEEGGSDGSDDPMSKKRRRYD